MIPLTEVANPVVPGWAVDATVIQFIIAPVLLAFLGAIGWLARSYLQEIRHQVKNEHKTNLRDDLDRVIETQHKQADLIGQMIETQKQQVETSAKQAFAIDRIELAVVHNVKQIDRFESRFDAHVDKRALGSI